MTDSFQITRSTISCKDDEKHPGKRLLNVSGISFGYNEWLPIIKETSHHILCRAPGGKAWHSRGRQKYAKPAFIIFEKETHNGESCVKICGGSWMLQYDRTCIKESKKTALEKLDEMETAVK